MQLVKSPYIQNGTVMVPLRCFFEAISMKEKWEARTQFITVISQEAQFILQIDQSTASVNSRPVSLSTPPVISKNTTYVPLRFIIEQSGFQVTWDQQKSIAGVVCPHCG